MQEHYQRFKQISVCHEGICHDGKGVVFIYALDFEGIVWWIDANHLGDGVWKMATLKREGD